MEFLIYENQQAGIQIDYLMDWDIVEGFMGSVVVILSPQEDPKDTFRDNLNIMIQDLSAQPLTFEQYSALSIAQLKNLITKAKIVEPFSMTTAAGVPAGTMTYTGRQGKSKLKWYNVWTLIDTTAYVVTCTATRKSYSKLLPVFKQMLSSFKIL